MDPGELERSLALLLPKLRQLAILKPPLAELPICTKVAVETLCSPQASAQASERYNFDILCDHIPCQSLNIPQKAPIPNFHIMTFTNVFLDSSKKRCKKKKHLHLNPQP